MFDSKVKSIFIRRKTVSELFISQFYMHKTADVKRFTIHDLNI